MTPDPWLDPAVFSWLPGTVLGGLGALYGAAMGSLVSVRSLRGVMYGVDAVLIALSAVMLLLGVAGYFAGQPAPLVGGLALAGVIGVVVFSLLWVALRSVYRQLDRQL